MNCPYCKSNNVKEKGFRVTKSGKNKRYFCKDCNKGFSVNSEKIIKDTYNNIINKEFSNSTINNILTQDFNDYKGTIESKSSNIKTMEDLLKYANIDLNIWEVDRCVINKWEVGARDTNGKIQKSPLFQIKIWLKRKTKDLSTEKQDIINEMKKFSPVYPNIKYLKFNKEKYMYEISVMDLHLAQLSWGKETGEDYDMKIAEERYINAVTDLANRVKQYNIEKIILPTGNDFFDVDNTVNETIHGTVQDVDSRWQKAFHESRKILVSVIDMLTTIAPVEVPIISGNHDFQRSYYLGEVLEAWYHNNKQVTINNSPMARKYVHYGNNLIGFTHGNEEKISDLPLIMAREQAKIWGQTKFQEWHIGHTHKKKKLDYLAGDTFNGVSVKVLASLTSPDAWHYRKGYVKGIRAAESFLWHYINGLVGSYSSNLI